MNKIVTNVQDLMFYKTNKEYQDLCDKIEKISLQIKEIELEKLSLEHQKLKAEMDLHQLERKITSDILIKGNNNG